VTADGGEQVPTGTKWYGRGYSLDNKILLPEYQHEETF